MKSNLFQTLCLSALTLGALLPGQAFGKQATGVKTLKTGVYYIINDQRQKGTDLYVYVSDNSQLKGMAVPSAHNVNHNDVFVLHSQGGDKYTIQSLRNGKYVQTVSGNNQVFKVADGSYTFDITKQTGVTSATKTYFNIFHDTKNHQNCWHLDANKDVVQWKPLSENGGHGLSPSEFIFEEVTTMTADSVRKILATKSKAVDPREDLNAYYQIISNPYGISMREDYVAGNLTTETYSASDYLFLWKLEKLSSGRYAFKNAVTGKYIVPQGTTKSKFYTTSTSQGTGFDVKQNLTDPYETVFEMYDGSGNGIHCAQSQGYHPVGWNIGEAANKWIFKKVTVNDAKLKQQQDAYNERVDLKQNGSTYATTIAKYFSDAACTTVTDEVKNMADDALKTKMAADKLPSELQAIVLKMKNQTWTSYKSGTNWEQRYRIHDYKVYSEYEYGSWARVNGLGYNYGDLTNPTGITAQDGDNLFIFVGADIPQGATLKAQLIPMGSRTGTEVTLKKGLNVIFNRFENSVCISYIGKTFNTGKTLKSFRDMPIHVEGGKVNGFFDLTQNDDDSTWVKMQSDGLVWAKAFEMKDTAIVLHMPGADCKKYTPVKMKELVQIWNSIVQREVDMMGLRSRNTAKCNNLLNATGVDHNYMYASTGGTYYNYSTLGEVLNYDKMKAGNGVLWGPAHEFGHNHQQLVNMAGMTEISNNMFSNMIIFTSGHITSRSQMCTYTAPDGETVNAPESKVSTFADRFANKNYWFEYGTWGTTQMYYKLYLMYIASGNKPDFFHQLFLELAKKPMSGRGSTTCRGTTDYLRFAEACCKAANEDLSSFFQSWGFFYDVKDVVIGDYSNTTMNTTTAEWQASLKKMKAYPKGVGNNMIFIDDHIRYTPATYAGAKPGEKRQDFSEQAKIGRFGNYGSWDAFRPDSLGQGWAVIGSQKDVNGKRTYTMTAKNNKVVGYKVYDATGNLVYFANTKTFTIPKKVMDAAKSNVVIKVCGSDGSEVDPGVEPTAIRAIEKQPVKGGLVDVYNLSGALIRSNVEAAKATVGLPAGIYVVGDKKIVVE